ncbi:DUF4831 family protein [Proteiniphilum sp. UBA1028]|uniref:DUF4831 family protein n=1 Tax=Proteiniphilum sp. UBA1028 TaxID=1947251 RepID=UPI0026000EAB|nr:DUF4831 family protein [Proteiniphilum sp. UBA1028]
MSTKYFILPAFILAFTAMQAQKTTRVNAIKANDYGVIYSLPKTSFEITILVKKSIYQRGDFYPYAQRYLGIDDPVTENRVVFTLEDVSVKNRGIPDKTNSYMVQFQSKTFEPYVYLREDGLIVAVNAEPTSIVSEGTSLPQGNRPAVNPRRFLSQEALMAGSIAKQAELVARQIFDLRQSRTDILTGEAESMPPDGNAYKVVMDEIDLQERALTELFAGSLQTEYFVRTYTVVPDVDDIDKMVIARISEKLGPVDADNLAGEPILLSLQNKTPEVRLQLPERDVKRLETKFTEGLVYNVPGKAELTIEFRNEIIRSMEADVVQYGSQDVLTRKMFDNMKQPIKVFFYPELGAIRQIIQ